MAAAPRIPNFTGWLAGVTGATDGLKGMETRFTKSGNQAIVVGRFEEIRRWWWYLYVHYDMGILSSTR